MIKRKRTFSVLGISLLAALGLMSVSAAGAQAGSWTIDGKAPTSYPAGIQLQGGPVSILGSGVEIECPEMIGEGNITWKEGGKTGVQLIGCVVLGGEEACEIPTEEYDRPHFKATLKLNASGSELTFEGIEGTLKMVDVEEQCTAVNSGGGGEEVISMWGNMIAHVGAPAVQLGLNFTESTQHALSLDAWGGLVEFHAAPSMSLTGANAGKVLGTTSS